MALKYRFTMFLGLSNQQIVKMADEYDTVAPPNSKRMKTDDAVEQKKVLYVVLEGCSLETAQVRGLLDF